MFEALYEQHQRYVLNYANRVAEHGMGEDIAQIAWMKVYKNLHQFEQSANFRTWICAIVRNIAIDTFRRKQHKGRNTPMVDVEVAHLVPDSKPSPEQNLLRREAIARIKCELLKVDKRSRTAFLVSVSDRGYRNEAERLVVPEGTLKSRSNRTRTELRRRFSSKRKYTSEPQSSVL